MPPRGLRAIVIWSMISFLDCGRGAARVNRSFTITAQCANRRESMQTRHEGALMAMDAAVDFAARISGATTDALMAGAFANANAKVLTDRLGRKPTDGELYMAHFLGASGAARFISAAEANPTAKAADLFPRAAQANSAIFYDKQGTAKSLKQVYAGLVSRHDVIGATRFAAATSATGTKVGAGAASVAAALPAAPIDTFRDVPSTTMVKTTSFTRPAI